MRVLYLDIDALRPDHLGCYGYHRDTSPNLDRIASRAVRFTNCYASDTPCCPSRTSLFSGKFGINQGVMCHAGERAVPFGEGRSRGFQDGLGRDGWMASLRDAGYHTATVSSFGHRHSAWWWYAGFSEVHDTGDDGMEPAHEVTPAALDWLRNNGSGDRWFLHVNYWDVHTPYRTPEAFGNPFADEPLPSWYTEALRREHWAGVGPQCARERGALNGEDDHHGRYPRQPHVIASMDDARRMFDGYDTAIRYVDHHIGLLLGELDRLGVLDETAIVVSADHGETLGELNIYGCHQTADHITTRVPMIVHWPGLTDAGRTDDALHYHLDVAATLTELAGGKPHEDWDGRGFASAFREGAPSAGQAHLVLSHMQGSCQRAVRFNRDGGAYHFVRTYHDGLHGYPDRMLFEVASDPHELIDLAATRPDLTEHAATVLEAWLDEHLEPGQPDPMDTILAEGGPPHSRGWLSAYLKRLRDTGRADAADSLAARHGPPTPKPVISPDLAPASAARRRVRQRV